MDRMAAAMGAFTCIRSDPVEPVDCESPCRERSSKRTFTHLHKGEMQCLQSSCLVISLVWR